MKTKDVFVVPYDSRWSSEFLRIKTELEKVVGECALAIEHVGSTSVEGLAAKPIIDIDIVIHSYDDFSTTKARLATLGYEYEGDLGIKEREAFKYVDKPEFMTHHVYVCPETSAELHRHITFRDYLRTHPEDRDEYARVKIEAAKRFPQDIDGYLDEKTPCILAIYQKCGLLVG